MTVTMQNGEKFTYPKANFVTHGDTTVILRTKEDGDFIAVVYNPQMVEADDAQMESIRALEVVADLLDGTEPDIPTGGSRLLIRIKKSLRRFNAQTRRWRGL